MSSENKVHRKIPFVTIGTAVLITIVVLASLSFLAFSYYFSDKIFPNVYVAGINIGGRTRQEAQELLAPNLQVPETIALQAKDRSFELATKEIEVRYDTEETINRAFMQYHRSSFVQDSIDQLSSFFKPFVLSPVMHINNEKLEEYLNVTADSQESSVIYPSLKLNSGIVTVNAGKPGEELDTDLAKQKILSNLETLNFSPITLDSRTVNPALTDIEIGQYKERGEKLLGKMVILQYEYATYKLQNQKLLDLLDPRGTVYDTKVNELIAKDLEPLFNRPPQNAAFKFVEGKVQEFKPAKDGITINEDQLQEDLKSKIAEIETSDSKGVTLVLPVQTAPATVTTKEVNDLGINELIGRGTSVFKGSIASRIFNIGHASGQLNGVLIPPNTVFSFDNTVGDVSQLTGYKQAYIIQNGRTILGDGGGLCQVSTTLFRAAMNAGLPIVERRAHAYRVGYYEQDSGPGLDATVYVPTTDFKFKNDTPNTILIQTIFDPKALTLAFELYGTKDGRSATITKPVITKQIAPPEDKYIDDPTLPTGKVNQVEHKAWGATVKFDYSVTRNGETIFQKTFTSVYQPWGAVFMKGTGPAV